MFQKPIPFLGMLACSWLIQAAAFGDPAVTFEVTKQPRGSYTENATILYQVRLHFPSSNGEPLRLLAPEPDLENLEFLGISQEVIASRDPGTGLEQILTLRFRPLKAGPGKIHEIKLTWAREDGTEGPSLEIPAATVVIRKSLLPYVKWAALAASIALGASSGIVLWVRKKRKLAPEPIPEKTLEDIFLAEFASLRNEIRRAQTADFLTRLSKLTEGYLAQKLHWNKPRDGYNTLARKAEGEWAKKDVQELEESLNTIERLRYSGEEAPEHELLKLHQTIVSLIEKKRVV